VFSVQESNEELCEQLLTSGKVTEKNPRNVPATVATAADNVEKANKAVNETPNISVRWLAQHLRKITNIKFYQLLPTDLEFIL